MKTALSAFRYERPDVFPDAELVVVERHGDRLSITLDDGNRIDLNVWELLVAAAHSDPVTIAA